MSETGSYDSSGDHADTVPIENSDQQSLDPLNIDESSEDHRPLKTEAFELDPLTRDAGYIGVTSIDNIHQHSPLNMEDDISTDMGCERMKIRGEIIGLRYAGWSIRRIAKHLGVAKSTISRWIARERTGEGIQSRRQTGQPKKTTAQEDLRLIEHLISHPLATYEQWRHELGLNICAETVRSRCRSAGIPHRATAKSDN